MLESKMQRILKIFINKVPPNNIRISEGQRLVKKKFFYEPYFFNNSFLRALQRLQQQIVQSNCSMDKLRELAEVPSSELSTDFSLIKQPEKNRKFEEERTKIRVYFYKYICPHK